MRTRFLIVAAFLLALAGPLAAQPVEGPNGNFYEFVAGSFTWDEAKTAAEASTYGGAPGYLVTVTSAEEQTFAGGLISTDAWLGLYQDVTDGPWLWVSGETFSYENWNVGEPNDVGNIEDCAHFWNSNKSWNDHQCTITMGYVVEYDAADFVPQSNTFPTTAVVAGGGDAGMPDMTITCNAGLPLTQTAPVGTTFTVTQLAAGDVCTVVLAGDVDDGYEATGYSCSNGTVLADMAGCEYTMGVASAAWTTTVQVAASPVEFSVDVDWDISPDANPGTGAGAMVEIMCMDMYGYTATTQPAGPLADMPVIVTLVPEADGTSYCDASLVDESVGSAVDANECLNVPVKVGMNSTCAITATAFYEGIPTLSQYGMAIMALLMLGLGFVGFRRFI